MFLIPEEKKRDCISPQYGGAASALKPMPLFGCGLVALLSKGSTPPVLFLTAPASAAGAVRTGPLPAAGALRQAVPQCEEAASTLLLGQQAFLICTDAPVRYGLDSTSPPLRPGTIKPTEDAPHIVEFVKMYPSCRRCRNRNLCMVLPDQGLRAAVFSPAGRSRDVCVRLQNAKYEES